MNNFLNIYLLGLFLMLSGYEVCASTTNEQELIVPKGHITSQEDVKVLVETSILNRSSLQTLVLDDNKLGEEGMDQVMEALKQTPHLKKLSVSGCDLGSIGGLIIADHLLPQHTQLTALNLSRNNIGGWALQGLSEALVKEPLEDLNLSTNPLGPEIAGILYKGLCATSALKNLNLQATALNSEAIDNIARGANTNSSLQTLDLSANEIGDGGAISLSMMLAENNTLCELNLNQCQITDRGFEELARGLKENTRLQKLTLKDNPLNEQGQTLFSTLMQEKFDINWEEGSIDRKQIKQLSTDELLPQAFQALEKKNFTEIARIIALFEQDPSLKKELSTRLDKLGDLNDKLEAAESEISAPEISSKGEVLVRLRDPNIIALRERVIKLVEGQ